MCNSKRNQCLSLINCLESDASVNIRYPLAEKQGQFAFMCFQKYFPEKPCYCVQCRTQIAGRFAINSEMTEKGLLKFSGFIGLISVQTTSFAGLWFMQAAGNFPDKIKSPSSTTNPHRYRKYLAWSRSGDGPALCLIISCDYVSILFHKLYINVDNRHTEGGIVSTGNRDHCNYVVRHKTGGFWYEHDPSFIREGSLWTGKKQHQLTADPSLTLISRTFRLTQILFSLFTRLMRLEGLGLPVGGWAEGFLSILMELQAYVSCAHSSEQLVCQTLGQTLLWDGEWKWLIVRALGPASSERGKKERAKERKGIRQRQKPVA